MAGQATIKEPTLEDPRAQLLAALPVTERRLQLAGVATAVLEGGDGPPLVLLHGPGGYAAAFLAADLGMKVALVDPEANPGGVCVYRGCIPSKALLHVAKLVDESRHAKAWGIEFGEPKIDLDKLREFKNNVVKRLTGGTGQLVRHRKISYIQGRAEIVDAHTLRISTAAGGEEKPAAA